jgi:hypothetical protein
MLGGWAALTSQTKTDLPQQGFNFDEQTTEFLNAQKKPATHQLYSHALVAFQVFYAPQGTIRDFLTRVEVDEKQESYLDRKRVAINTMNEFVSWLKEKNDFKAKTVRTYAGAVAPGQTKLLAVTFTFPSGSFTVTNTTFQGTGAELLQPATIFPAIFDRGTATTGNGTIYVQLSVPADAEPSNYTVQVTVSGKDPSGTYQSAAAPLTFIVEKPQPASTEKLLWLLVAVIAIVAVATIALLTRRRR